MMKHRPLVAPVLVLAVMFTLGFVATAFADVANLDDFQVMLDGTTIFNDTFGAGLTLTGGPPPAGGVVQPSGQNFSNGTPANYLVSGTVTETGNIAVMNSALGAPLVQTPPFVPNISLNETILVKGQPPDPLSLTPSNIFSTSALYQLSVPQTPGGLYQVEY